MKKIKNYQRFLESQDQSEPGGEVAITFSEPIKIGNKIYKDTKELEKDYHIGSMSQSGDQITINGQDLQDWVNSMNMGGEGERSEEDERMEPEEEEEY